MRNSQIPIHSVFEILHDKYSQCIWKKKIIKIVIVNYIAFRNKLRFLIL